MSGGRNFTHSWQVTPAEAIRLQEQIRWRVKEQPLRRPIKLVAGVDAALSEGRDRIVAAVVVLEVEGLCLDGKPSLGPDDLRVVEQQYAWAKLVFPYIPGLLSFREAPVVLKALGKLRHRPDVVILDAQGKAHPRGAGLASHVGVLSNLPCVGCAKSRLVGVYKQPGRQKASCTELTDGNGQVIGRVVRTRAGVKPVYVSVGHLVSLDQAVQLVLTMAVRYRLPEPTRLAHVLANKLRSKPPGKAGNY